ncbi:hypothetical protein ACEWY4_018558 [Coilia grayii]|uniref:CCHC-type domain-containing protein n=1 Tax=Coilia grayii TaxID=363190 RepID=A0ABD1JDJ0_9TELE
MAVTGTLDLEKLTRRHGIRIEHNVSVEECSLAVGAVIGHEHIKSASRMNNAIVLFLATVEKAREMILKGVVINDTLWPVLPLSSPSKKIIISNVPPFIKDDLIRKELERYGRVVSSIRKIPLGCKSPLLKHLVSFRRQVYMVLENGRDDLNLVLKLKVDGFDYVLFVTSDWGLKCFKCGSMRHTVRDCPGNDGAGQTLATDGVPSQDVTVPSVSEGPLLVQTGENGVHDDVQSDAVEADLSLDHMPTGGSSSTPLVAGSVNDMITEELAALTESTSDGPRVTRTVEVETAGSGQLGSQEFEMDVTFKVPFKRKGDHDNDGENKVKKVDVTDDVSDAESVDSNWSDCSQVDPNIVDGKVSVHYKAEDIIRFLRDTKGQQGVEVEHYFPNRHQFINDVSQFRKEGAFTERETARLRKFLSKLRRRIRLEEQSVHPM